MQLLSLHFGCAPVLGGQIDCGSVESLRITPQACMCDAEKTRDDAKTISRSSRNCAESVQMERQAFKEFDSDPNLI